MALRHIALRTRDLEKTRRFYLDHLGLREPFTHPGMLFLETHSVTKGELAWPSRSSSTHRFPRPSWTSPTAWCRPATSWTCWTERIPGSPRRSRRRSTSWDWRAAVWGRTSTAAPPGSSSSS
ncbi:MAG: hypothetical protein DMD86_09035 [Candidatus Rokuibacteriota bacterium]|nr:MAG: hypothetical protein DMD86_09035 [Candidatus Rokubacteria bacterium]